MNKSQRALVLYKTSVLYINTINNQNVCKYFEACSESNASDSFHVLVWFKVSVLYINTVYTWRVCKYFEGYSESNASNLFPQKQQVHGPQ